MNLRYSIKSLALNICSLGGFLKNNLSVYKTMNEFGTCFSSSESSDDIYTDLVLEVVHGNNVVFKKKVGHFNNSIAIKSVQELNFVLSFYLFVHTQLFDDYIKC